MKKKYFTTYEIEGREERPRKEITRNDEKDTFSFLKDKFLDLNIDDMLLLVLIFILLTEDEPDMMSIMALAYIFFV